MSKRLVAYFSASGVTAKVAENLADAIGADIFEIQPEVPYTKADLNWMDKKSRSTIEMSDPTSRPAIAAKRDNMDEWVAFSAYPQCPHLIFPASQVFFGFRPCWKVVFAMSFFRHFSHVSEEMSASWGAITSIWSFKHLSLSSFTSRP